MKKLWCIAPSHPLVIKVAEKYNLSKDDAKTILNNARKDNPALQANDVTLEFLEGQDSFKKALAVFTEEKVNTEDVLFKNVSGTSKEVRDFQEELRHELELQFSEEEVEDIMQRQLDMIENTKMSKVSAHNIANILRTFKDTRRLEFLGNWICKYMSELMTLIESSADVRESVGIPKLNRRIDYFYNQDALNAVYDVIKDVLYEKMRACQKKGRADLATELNAVISNFHTLLFMYGGRLFRTEGVEIGIDGAASITEVENDSPERNDANEDNDDDNEDEGEKTTDTFGASDQNKSIFSKIVPSIKILLSNMHEIDSKGNDIGDPYGYDLQTYISVPKAVNKLLTLCRGCQTYEQMIQILEKNKKSTPWIGQLLDVLDTQSQNDVTGEVTTSASKKEQLQSMFYQSCRKQHTRMRQSFMQHNEDGYLTTINRDANVGHRSENMLNSVKSKFRRFAGLGIFKDNAIDFDAFTRISKELSAGTVKEPGVTGELAIARGEAKDIARSAFQEEKTGNYAEAFKKLSVAEEHLRAILNQFGIKISKQVLDEYLSNKEETGQSDSFWGTYKDYGDADFKTHADRLDSLIKKVKGLNDAFKRWGQAQKSGQSKDTPWTDPFIRKKGNSDYRDIRSISRWYENIINALTEFSPDSFESRTHINHKDYYSWNNPSTVMTIVENLTLKDKAKVQKYILKKYGKDVTWFLKPGSTLENPHFFSDWLEDLYHGQGRMLMSYSEKPSFCGKEYNEISDVGYAMSILTDYFSQVRQKKDSAWYRMLIASDKPKYSSILFTRYSDNSIDEANNWTEQNYHSVISRKAIDFFAQELRRCIDVVNFATQDGVKIDDYDITVDDSNKQVFDKIKTGNDVTVDDVVKDGKYIFRGTGAAFYLNKFILKEIEGKTVLGRYVVDRIFNSRKYAGKNLVEDSIIPVFKTGFHQYMQDIKKKYYDYLKKKGLFNSQTVRASADEGGNTEHLMYLRGNLAAWHEGEERFTQGMYARKEEAAELALAEDKIDITKKPERKPYYCELLQFKDDLEEFIYNNWLAKANMSEIFDVDLAFYGNTTNFQKRNAQVISSGYVVNPTAKIHGELVSDGKYRSITLRTVKEKSNFIPNLEVLLRKRMSQITDPDQRQQFELGMQDTLKKLESFDPTDGQALTSLTGLRKRMAGLGDWSISDSKELDQRGYEVDENNNKHYIFTDEAVYWRMKRGYKSAEDKAAQTYDLLHVFAQPQKPFVYSFTEIDRPGRGKITVPVQHKNSEYALIFLSSFIASEKPDSQIAAIAKFMEESADADIKAGIDTVNFDSAVKIGGNSEAIDLTGLNGQQTLEKLRTAVYGSKTAKRVKDNYRQGTVTEYDVEDYKIVQQKPEHFKHGNQPIGSQIKILSINNINDDIDCPMPDGTTIKGKELKRRYFAALRKKMQGVERAFRSEMGLRLPSAQRIHKLSNALKSAMSTDQKFTVEMRRALSVINRDGVDQFVLPLDETGQQSAVEAMLYSKIRRTYYKEKTKGGIVVQATSWGASKDLAIRFYSSNPEDAKRGGVVPTLSEFKKEHNYGDQTEAKYKEYLEDYQTGYAYFEAEIPMPDYVRKMIANRDGSIDSKYYNPDGSWNMEEIRKVVPESVFDAICYRVPTEAKYSMMVCKITRFSPEAAGSVAKYPIELTVFTGSDFDIDTDFIEIRPEEGASDAEVDNELFDLQLAALRSQGSVQETFKPGDFSDLSDLSYRVTLLSNGYSQDDLNKMTKEKVKKLCMEVEDMDLMNPETDSILHHQNTDAKGMIAIAAVGVTSHAFISLYNDIDTQDPNRDPNVHPENYTRVVISEGSKKKEVKSFTVVDDSRKNKVTQRYFGGAVILDMMYDMDGKLISTEISKYVGASADAAKDAAEYRLNINKDTLPILVLMHRLGISSKVARMFIAQPVIRKVLETKGTMSSRPFGALSMIDACDTTAAIVAQGDGMNEEQFQTTWNDVIHNSGLQLVYSELMENIEHPKEQSTYDKLKLIHIFSSLYEIDNAVKNLDSFTRYNSSNAMRGSSFIDRFIKRRRLEKLQSNLDAEKPIIILPEDIKINPEFPQGEFGKLCSMFPYIGQTVLGETELTENIILENMHTYNSAFFEAVDRVLGQFPSENENDDAQLVKDLYTGWRNYLLFVGPNRIADFHDRATFKYYTRDFAVAYATKKEELEQSNPELYKNIIENNTFLDSIGIRSTDGAHYQQFDYLTTDITGMSDTVLEQYKRDWEVLLNYPETRQLAIDLGIYFLARTAGFARDTPVNVMPLRIKEAIPGYVQAFEDADKMQWSEDDMWNFLLLFQCNNSENNKIVPYFYNTKNSKKTMVFENGALKFNEAAKNYVAKYTVTVDGGSKKFRMPVLKVDEQLYIIDPESSIEKEGEGENAQYFVPALPITKLGIPNVMAEYVGYDVTTSMFAKTDATGEAVPSDENFILEAPTVEPSSVVEFDEEGILQDGQRVGTFLSDAPFGNKEGDTDFDKDLAEDVTDSSGNAFLESRTYLRRTEKIANAFGLKVASIQRGIGFRNEGNYIINLSMPSDTKFGYNQHVNAMKIAAVASELGFKSGVPTVKTYTTDIKDADSVEFTIPVTDPKQKAAIHKIFAGATINVDRSEIQITVPIMDGLDLAISDVKAKFAALKKAGLTAADNIEVNYVIEDILEDSDKKQLLNEIKNENETDTESTAESQRTSENRPAGQRTQVRLEHLADLAIRKIKGEKVNDEIRTVFNEYKKPLKSTEASYTSRSLSDVVINSMGENIYNEVSALVSDKQNAKLNEGNLIDNLIINTANWIMGHRSEEALLEMLGRSGLTEESSKGIIAVISDKLKELDIC